MPGRLAYRRLGVKSPPGNARVTAPARDTINTAMERVDTIILGGGLVGLTTALALDAHGLSSVVIDPAPPATTLAKGFDGRASAIASASWRMLDAIGVADALRPFGCPIRRIEVRDGLQAAPLDFTPGDADEPLGTMVENRILRQALHDAAAKASNVTLRAPARAIAVDRDATTEHARPDGDVPSGFGVTQSVGQQVVEHLPNARRVHIHEDLRVAVGSAQRHRCLIAAMAPLLHAGVHEL